MIAEISVAICSILFALVLGYSIGESNLTNVEKKRFKLECQNIILEREVNKLRHILEYLKDNRNDILVSNKGIIIYYPCEEDEGLITMLKEWAND